MSVTLVTERNLLTWPLQGVSFAVKAGQHSDSLLAFVNDVVKEIGKLFKLQRPDAVVMYPVLSWRVLQ